MNFDPVARPYRWLERLAFGGALQRCRTALLEHTKSATNVLILGEGDGRFLKQFLRENTGGKITVVDSSKEMIRLARGRIGPAGRVQFVHADIRETELPDEEYDLIVTNFFLDCFDQCGVEEVIEAVAKKLVNKGQWLWSDFAIPESGFGRFSAKWIGDPSR